MGTYRDELAAAFDRIRALEDLLAKRGVGAKVREDLFAAEGRISDLKGERDKYRLFSVMAMFIGIAIGLALWVGHVLRVGDVL